MIRKYTTFKKYRFMIKLVIGIFILAVSSMASVYIISFYLGPPKLINDQNTIYYSDSGEIIGNERGPENRYWVDLNEISPDVIEAVLTVEDQNFYDHIGFDFKRIIGAVLTDLQNLSLKEGASTLTQQYARNLYLTHEKTWTRKLKEAFYTVRLEMYYSKDEILEGYLNMIYYGHGSYGIEAASRYFFDKNANELSLAESTILAGIPKGPTYYSPFNDEEKANERQERILSLMLGKNVITEEEYSVATEEKLVYAKPVERKKEVIGPYFQDTVLKEAAGILQLDVDSIKSGGFQIYTTLNADLQKKLEKEITQQIQAESKMEIGAIAMNPFSGGIQALVGGRAYEKSPFNRAISAKRMTGSTFKPFLYYAALNNGYTASTMLMSKPTTFELDGGEVYKPSNYNGYYADEPISLAQALALSDNIYAVKTNMFLGVEKLVDAAKRFGITSKLPSVPSLALGTASVSVNEMVTGYGMLANGGREIDSYTIKKVVNRHGKTVFDREETLGKQVLDPKKAFILTHLMTGMFDRELNGYMSVTGSTITDKLTRPYAGKSGTTISDSWMIGFSPTLVTGIWTGYDDNSPMEIVPETAYAKNIWAEFMEAAHKGTPKTRFNVPSGVVGVPIDPVTGERATPYCESSRVAYFEKGTEPNTHCRSHFPGGKDDDGGKSEDKGLFQRWFELFI